jgi:mono/diheme cytochrome c family protein
MTLAAAALIGGSAFGQSAATYTADQAQQGMTQYQSNCSQCHGPQLEGIDAPSLKGADFRSNWQTAGGVHDYFSVAMPPTAPGKLGEDVYLNILAYIMQENGIPASDTPLVNDPAKLNAIDLVALAQAQAPATAPADAAPATAVPQAFTWGKTLPSVAQPGAAGDVSQAAPATEVPQAFTWGKTLPTATPATEAPKP